MLAARYSKSLEKLKGRLTSVESLVGKEAESLRELQFLRKENARLDGELAQSASSLEQPD